MARILLILLFSALCCGQARGQQVPPAPLAAGDSLKKDSLVTRTKADTIIDLAKTFLGTRYCYGSCSPKNGFDCSGFVYYVFKENGVLLPRSSYEMGKFGKQVPLSECRKGDIILFRGPNLKVKGIGHAALIISEQGQPVRFIHSSSNTKSGGVIISSYDESSYYSKRFVKVIRVL
ncbi:MAG TPA: C40 family peptidase [Bacteroidia bacterium]|jgi:cell wall-associated NlpC family hydrolase